MKHCKQIVYVEKYKENIQGPQPGSDHLLHVYYNYTKLHTIQLNS